MSLGRKTLGSPTIDSSLHHYGLVVVVIKKFERRCPLTLCTSQQPIIRHVPRAGGGRSLPSCLIHSAPAAVLPIDRLGDNQASRGNPFMANLDSSLIYVRRHHGPIPFSKRSQRGNFLETCAPSARIRPIPPKTPQARFLDMECQRRCQEQGQCLECGSQSRDIQS